MIIVPAMLKLRRVENEISSKSTGWSAAGAGVIIETMTPTIMQIRKTIQMRNTNGISGRKSFAAMLRKADEISLEELTIDVTIPTLSRFMKDAKKVLKEKQEFLPYVELTKHFTGLELLPVREHCTQVLQSLFKVFCLTPALQRD